MVFKINISTKEGKTFKLETDSENLIGKKINELILGEEINENLKGYSLKITGLSDDAGFPAIPTLEYEGLKKVLLNHGRGMKKKKPNGLRKKKTVAGNTITTKINQINTIIDKQGEKKLEEIFPEQNQKKEASETKQPESQENKEEDKKQEKENQEVKQEDNTQEKKDKKEENKEEKKQEEKDKEEDKKENNEDKKSEETKPLEDKK